MKLTRRVLHHRAHPVDFQYPVKNQQLEQDLFRFMIEQDGIGLAATQVGIKRRVFVMQVDNRARACFNPEIQSISPKQVRLTEGCLSFPNEECTLARPESIEVRYQDHRGEWHQEKLQGLESRCFQHELDHLDGITMWDRLKEQHAEQSRN